MIVERLQKARRAAVRHARAAERAGFSAHEQALTEIVLTRAAARGARVWTFTQREEAATGADWLWWWTNGSEWFGALVQAKRNKPRRVSPWYDFGYRSGSGAKQIDLLLAHGRQLGVPAIYVLYNQPRIELSVPVGTPCCTAPWESWRTRLGVSVIPALAAQVLAGRNEDVAAQYARPLECLACAGKRALPLLPPIARSIVDSRLRDLLTGNVLPLPRVVARGLLSQLMEMRRSQLRSARPDLRDTDHQIFQQLPDDRGHFSEPYFEHVLRGLQSQPPWYLSALLEGGFWENVADELEGVAGVVLFDDVEGLVER